MHKSSWTKSYHSLSRKYSLTHLAGLWVCLQPFAPDGPVSCQVVFLKSVHVQNQDGCAHVFAMRMWTVECYKARKASFCLSFQCVSNRTLTGGQVVTNMFWCWIFSSLIPETVCVNVCSPCSWKCSGWQGAMWLWSHWRDSQTSTFSGIKCLNYEQHFEIILAKDDILALAMWSCATKTCRYCSMVYV